MFYLVFLIIILIALVSISVKNIGKGALPLTLIFSFWATLWGLYLITPIQYTDFGFLSFSIVVSCSLLFFAGYYFGFAITSGRSGPTREIDTRRVKMYFAVFSIFSMIVLSTKLQYLTSSLASIGTLFRNLYLIRDANLQGSLEVFSLSKVFEIFVLPTITISCLLFVFGRRAQKKLAVVMIVLVMLYQLTNMSRGFIVYLAIIFLVVAILTGGSAGIKKKKIALTLAAFVVIFQMFSVVRSADGAASLQRYTLLTMSYEEWVPVFVTESTFFQSNTLFLHYFTSGLYGLVSYVEGGNLSNDYYEDIRSLRGITAVSDKIFGGGYSDFNPYEYTRRPAPTNVYTFFRDHLEDFGLVGTLILHSLWGFLLGLTYKKYLRTPSVRNIVVPLTLVVWYLYGAWIMQTVFVSSFFWPFVTYYLVYWIEKRNTVFKHT